jgi:hypothetical protein
LKLGSRWESSYPNWEVISWRKEWISGSDCWFVKEKKKCELRRLERVRGLSLRLLLLILLCEYLFFSIYFDITMRIFIYLLVFIFLLNFLFCLSPRMRLLTHVFFQFNETKIWNEKLVKNPCYRTGLNYFLYMSIKELY